MAISSPKKRQTAKKVGRPPAGDKGERVKDYPQVSFRLPKDSRDTLVALSKLHKQPQWRLIVNAVQCYVRALPRQDRAVMSRIMTKKRSRRS